MKIATFPFFFMKTDKSLGFLLGYCIDHIESKPIVRSYLLSNTSPLLHPEEF